MVPVRILVVAAMVLTAAAAAAAAGFGEGGLTLMLERANHVGMKLSQLKDLDRVRHGRFLAQQSAGVVDFPVQGSFNPFTVGLYYTRVKLGNPAKEFYVQIDTGSDVMWVNCVPCSGCPSSSGLNIRLEFYDPTSSTTASLVSCSDPRCFSGQQSSDAYCTNRNQCGYSFQYGDGSGTSGYYVSDGMYFNTILGNSLFSNSSASVIFGCSITESGDLMKSDRAVDGIFGFGQASLSVISQLSSQGITPKAFSHCLSGQNSGGGILVLGEIVEPNIVFTPIVPSQSHYSVNLESISVNGQKLDIPSSVFSASDSQGTIIDSGTTLAYLTQQAYVPFVNAISQFAASSVQSMSSNGNNCFLTTSSISSSFPQVAFTFSGGATMVLNPQDYLLQQNSIGGAGVWCIAIQQQAQEQGYTILGDLVLKDKIVVYDLAGQRIGWADYDCSAPVNVSTSNTSETYVNAGQLNNNSSGHRQRMEMATTILITVMVAALLWLGFYGDDDFSFL